MESSRILTPKLKLANGGVRFLKSLRILLSPRTGRLPLDILLLLVVGALHHTVMPSLFGSVIVFDLMTPWLVATFVAAPLQVAALMGALGAVILETSSAAPAGLYLSAYWVLLVVLYFTRATLSWRHVFPWVVSIALAELWVIAFETFVTCVNEGELKLDTAFVAAQAARVLVAMIFGAMISVRLRAEGFATEAMKQKEAVS